LFVEQNVDVTNGDDHAFRDGVSNKIMHETCDNKNVHPRYSWGG
jgi:hypothetical protein